MDEKPSRNEDEYFAKKNAELIAEQRVQLDKARLSAERAAHLMHCPKCGGQLAEVSFQHLRVDRCVDCGGLWFDKGEIEMLEHLDQSKVRQFVRSLFGLKW